MFTLKVGLKIMQQKDTYLQKDSRVLTYCAPLILVTGRQYKGPKQVFDEAKSGRP